MSKAQELREALAALEDFADMGTYNAADICATICDTLGITREMLPRLWCPTPCKPEDPCEYCAVARALTTILEVAGR